MYLKRLLTDAGGDENAAIAGYTRAGGVRDRGMYDDTQRYVANVQAEVALVDDERSSGSAASSTRGGAAS